MLNILKLNRSQCIGCESCVAICPTVSISKMTKQMLRNIWVKTKEELAIRIYKCFDEINEPPVIYYWAWNLDDIDASETVVTEIFSKSVVN